MQIDFFEDRDDFPRMPDINPYDEESGLFMNPIHTWSTSPYLGAVKSKKDDSWVAQVHIPQEIWERSIRDNPKLHNALPDSFFNEKGKDRSSIRIKVKDPRQAAWIVQNVLYGSYDTNELIVEYLLSKYINGGKGVDAWEEILRAMPKFQGAPVQVTDHDTWFAKHQQQDKETRVQQNTNATYAKAPAKIKQAILAFVAKGGNRKRIFGTTNLSLNQLGAVIDRAIEKLGVQHFLQGINVKDPAGFNLKQFVGEGLEESARLDADFESDIRKYKSASSEERIKLEKKWGARAVYFKEAIEEAIGSRHGLRPSAMMDACLTGFHNAGVEYYEINTIVGGNSCYMDFEDANGATYRVMIEKTGDL